MIDILIPTYNRESHLIKNIYHLDKIIRTENLNEYFQLLISDNCSTDNTALMLKKHVKEIKLKTTIFQQEQNIGLENNSIFLLEKSKSNFIMYIGDDDYLPEGYLSYVINKINNEPLTSAIIPGISSLFADGSVMPARSALFDEMEYPPGFYTAYQISHFGHQLSGVLLKREGLYNEYTEKEKLRNIYPFIFFLAYNNLRGISYYAPKFKVLVSQSNSKDWAYDDSGLLTDILKNYKILYPSSPIKRLFLCVSIISKQRWRLRIDTSLSQALKSFIHLMTSKNVDLSVKLSLFLLYPYFYSRATLSSIIK